VSLTVLLKKGMTSRDRYVCNSEVVVMTSANLYGVFLAQVDHMQSFRLVVVSCAMTTIENLDRLQD
jgi:hypothetical protein